MSASLLFASSMGAIVEEEWTSRDEKKDGFWRFVGRTVR